MLTPAKRRPLRSWLRRCCCQDLFFFFKLLSQVRECMALLFLSDCSILGEWGKRKLAIYLLLWVSVEEDSCLIHQYISRGLASKGGITLSPTDNCFPPIDYPHVFICKVVSYLFSFQYLPLFHAFDIVRDRKKGISASMPILSQEICSSNRLDHSPMNLPSTLRMLSIQREKLRVTRQLRGRVAKLP